MISQERQIYFSVSSMMTKPNIFLEGTEYHKVINTLNTDLKDVSDWLNSNKLTLNLKKSHYIVFHRS